MTNQTFSQWLKNNGQEAHTLWALQDCLGACLGWDHPLHLKALEAWQKSEKKRPHPLLPTSDKDAAKQMKACNNLDAELGHGEADDLLCALLASLGYDETVKEYNKLLKWYA